MGGVPLALLASCAAVMRPAPDRVFALAALGVAAGLVVLLAMNAV